MKETITLPQVSEGTRPPAIEPQDYCIECAKPVYGTLPRVVLHFSGGMGFGYVFCDECISFLKREFDDQAKITKISVEAGSRDA